MPLPSDISGGKLAGMNQAPGREKRTGEGRRRGKYGCPLNPMAAVSSLFCEPGPALSSHTRNRDEERRQGFFAARLGFAAKSFSTRSRR